MHNHGCFAGGLLLEAKWHMSAGRLNALLLGWLDAFLATGSG